MVKLLIYVRSIFYGIAGTQNISYYINAGYKVWDKIGRKIWQKNGQAVFFWHSQC